MTMTMGPFALSRLSVFLLILIIQHLNVARSQVPDDADDAILCALPRHSYDPEQYPPVYTVGVQAFNGPGTGFALHNSTFSEYLSITAGRRFDPPIRFEVREMTFSSTFTDSDARLVDFLYTNPSHFACLDAEHNAQSLVSQISRRIIGPHAYELPQFGGVIAARADNDSINTIKDLKDKIIAAASISAFGGGQMQFYEMIKAGMSYISDPRQLVFTYDQSRIVNGVISGEFDVGFVRTDQIQRTKDPETGELVDPNLLKVIDPKSNVVGDGTVFPFQASTPLYPEWNLASLDFVPPEVSAEVQAAMLALRSHANAADVLRSCRDHGHNDDVGCDQVRCDTTMEIAEVAQRAMYTGGYAGFRTTFSYGDVRVMLQDSHFMTQDEETNIWSCAKPAGLYEAIRCPAGNFKKARQDVETGCTDAGLTCGDGYQCLCRPCTDAFDVAVSPTVITFDDEEPAVLVSSGCPKMSVCGTTKESVPISFRIVDNKKRQETNVNVTVRDGKEKIPVVVEQGLMDNTYDFTVFSDRVGTLILEIFFDDEQISESPLLVQVVADRASSDDNVDEDAGDHFLSLNSVKDIPSYFLLPPILGCLTVLFAMGTWCYVDKKTTEADSVWSVDASDLSFEKPPIVIGCGTFGLVLLAEYRGTLVAVKRVLPPQGKRKKIDVASPHSSCFDYPMDDTGLNSVRLNLANNKRDVTGVDSTAKFDRTGTSKRGEFSTMTLSGDIELNTAVVSGAAPKKAVVVKKKSYKKQKDEFFKEMRLLSKLRHPCIITVMGAVTSRGDEPMLVMEYMKHGSVYDLLHNETMVMEGELLLSILRDIVQGVRFLHSAKPLVIHGDLKAANVLVDSKFRAKVSDFGLSQKKHGSAAGTPFWMAPELLRGESGNTTKSDMYSLGILLYELYARKEPYDGEDPNDVIELVCDSVIHKRPPVPRSCPQKVTDLMKSLLMDDPERRPTAMELDKCLRILDAANIEPHRQIQEQSAGGSKDLLYKVFPRHIADVLASGGRPEPESHDTVTIFFSDIVGFTTISSTLPAMKVADMLDRLYQSFDDLARKHELFKVETVGDAYVCASNLATKQNGDHVKRIAEFAIDAMKSASDTLIDREDPSKGHVEIRAGFHTGPVVSNVVGSLLPKYAIFGDTINVSSRMESTSVRGRIQCSAFSARILMDQAPAIPVTLRGEIPVKGKGKMKTCWVNHSGPQSPNKRGTLSRAASSSTNSAVEAFSSSGGGVNSRASSTGYNSDAAGAGVDQAKRATMNGNQPLPMFKSFANLKP